MKLIITSHNLGLWAADYIRARWQQKEKKPFVLGLPTGGTVVDMYAALCGLVKNGKMSFKDIVTFNMDEYVGLPPSSPQSYHYYMNQHLFNHVDIPAKQIHILDGQSADFTQTCTQYEQAIAQVGGIDLFLGGVGRNGHLAFNEPGSALDSHTRVIQLEESTRQANSRFFDNDVSKVPTHALTVGIGTVLAAKELLFLASGTEKAQAVARLAQGNIDIQWPITALKTHPQSILLVDEQAASKLDKNILADWQNLRQEMPEKDLIVNL